MSGIAGIFNLDGKPADVEVLKRMAAALAHRGPHSEGLWSDGPVAMAHRLLATLPDSLSVAQPFSNDTGSCITFDGRVDNRGEVRAALLTHGAILRTGADAELVLSAYEQWGEECVSKIIGDFAFAVWDGRRHQLFCARDRLGIRPFYYCSDERSFVFASEMQPFFEAGVDRKINFPLLGHQLTSSFGDQEQTRYTAIRRIPPRHTLTVRREKIAKRQYWDIDPHRSIKYRTDAEYAEHFLSLFREAVKCQLISRGPVGVRLSGGLDSGSIVCIAQSLLRENAVVNPGFESFSNIFEGLSCDERSYIGELVRQSGVKANLFSYDPGKPRAGLERAACYPDVLYQPVLLMNVPLYSAMQARGFHVVLDGTGGDELLASGCEHLTDLLAQGKFGTLWKQARLDSESVQMPFHRLLLNYCVIPFVPRPLKPLLRPINRFLQKNKPYRCVRSDFLRRIGVRGYTGRGMLPRGFPTRSQERVYQGLFVGWNATVAMETMDLFTSRFALEFRYPFFDIRLVEFLIALPNDQFWQGQYTKRILREAMRGVLPESVRTRRGKSEFSPVITSELQAHSVEIERVLRSSQMAKSGILDDAKLLKLYSRYRRQPTSVILGQLMFLLGLELWFRSIIAGGGSANE